MSPRLRQRAERIARLFRLRRVTDVEPQLPDTATAVAVIMDGNGRWARRRGLPTLAGHRAGTSALRRTVEAAPGLGVRSLAVYAFSTENWGRSEQEVTDLMALFADTIREQFPDLHRQGVQVRFVGRRDRCPPDLLQLMTDMEERTAANVAWIAGELGQGPWFAGETFTVADIAISTAFGMWRGALGHELPEALVAFQDRCQARSAYEAVSARMAMGG